MKQPVQWKVRPFFFRGSVEVGSLFPIIHDGFLKPSQVVIRRISETINSINDLQLGSWESKGTPPTWMSQEVRTWLVSGL